MISQILIISDIIRVIQIMTSLNNKAQSEKYLLSGSKYDVYI